MYGFAISCFNEGVGPIDLHLKMMSQPPWDEKLDPYYILHYTYGNDYTLEGVFTPGKYGAWRFDKRTYSDKPPPRNLGAPPAGMANELVSLIPLTVHRQSFLPPSGFMLVCLSSLQADNCHSQEIGCQLKCWATTCSALRVWPSHAHYHTLSSCTHMRFAFSPHRNV